MRKGLRILSSMLENVPISLTISRSFQEECVDSIPNNTLIIRRMFWWHKVQSMIDYYWECSAALVSAT